METQVPSFACEKALLPSDLDRASKTATAKTPHMFKKESVKKAGGDPLCAEGTPGSVFFLIVRLRPGHLKKINAFLPQRLFLLGCG